MADTELERLKERVKQLEAALLHLKNEASGNLYLSGVREVIGNTNFACMEDRITEADQILKCKKPS